MIETETRRIKIAVTAEEHDRIRLSAALMKTTMSGFCRQVIVEKADDLTREIVLPASSGRDSPRSKSARNAKK